MIWVPLVFSLFEDINYESIIAELANIQRPMVFKISHRKKSTNALLHEVSLVQTQLHLDVGLAGQRGVQTEHANHIRAAWQALNELDADIELKHVDPRICAAVGLVSLANMWSWFDVQCSQPAKRLAGLDMSAFLQGGDNSALPNVWIYPLVRQVRLLLLRSTENSPVIMLDPEQYFPSLDAPLYHGKRKQLGKHSTEETLAHVEGAVILWLQFPAETPIHREISQGIAMFVSVVHCAFGNYDFLYLQGVQDGIGKLRSTLKKKACLSEISWQELSTKLVSHPLANDQSREASVLRLLIEHLQSIPESPPRPLSQTAANYSLALKTGGQHGIFQFTGLPSQTHPQPTVPCLQPLPSTPDENIVRFCSFLQKAFAVANTHPLNPCPIQTRIIKRWDFLLPFRQLAPSKVVILEDRLGPFSPTKLKTRQGFFDALIFRLITQASDFLVGRRQVRLGSAEKFFQATKGMDRDFYNVRNATGRYDRSKNVPRIQQYWDQSISWEQFISNPNLTLLSLFKWLTGSVDGEKRFYGMGSLVGWLLASDYAYAGLVPVPTLSDVGYFIHTINLGAKDGLVLLDLPTNSKQECAESLEWVWKGIQEYFPSDEIDQMGLEPITLEHALCKYKRLFEHLSGGFVFCHFSRQ